MRARMHVSRVSVPASLCMPLRAACGENRAVDYVDVRRARARTHVQRGSRDVCMWFACVGGWSEELVGLGQCANIYRVMSCTRPHHAVACSISATRRQLEMARPIANGVFARPECVKMDSYHDVLAGAPSTLQLEQFQDARCEAVSMAQQNKPSLDSNIWRVPIGTSRHIDTDARSNN